VRIASVLVVALSAAGCNAIFGLDPVGTAAIDAAPEVPPDADPEADDDEDGVANGVDNCPTIRNADQANTEPPDFIDDFGDACDLCPATFDDVQHDEDGDQLGDRCDSCPHVDNPGQEDSLEPDAERDGVGDACDPNPTLGGDYLVFFDGFGGGDRDAEWQVILGRDTLVVAQDALALAAPMEKPVVAIVAPTAPDLVVETAIRVTGFDPVAAPIIGVIAQHSGLAGRVCVLDGAGQPNARWSVDTVDERGDLGNLGEITASGPLAAGQTYTLRIVAGQNVQHSCRARSNAFVTDAYVQSFNEPVLTVSGGPGLYLQGVAVRIPYVIAWGRGITTTD
jgi:hypothetical protein